MLLFTTSFSITSPMVTAGQKGTPPLQTKVYSNVAIVIRSQQIAAYNEVIKSFEEECKERNITVKAIYDLKGDPEESKRIVYAVRNDKQKPHLVLAVGVLAATLAKDQFADIPVIFCMVINHDRFNLQGANITGISAEAPLEDQFAILKEMLGSRKHIGVIYDPRKTGKIISDALQAAKKFDITLLAKEVLSEREVDFALKSMISDIDAFWIIPDGTVITKEALDTIFKRTLKKRIPTFCTSPAIVKAGALVSVSPDYIYTGKQAANLAQALLNNPTMLSLGLKQPDKLKITFNTSTAKMIGVSPTFFKTRSDVVFYP
ncbi:MAG: hypothetical protein DCC43_03445 [Candidatus Brocadia sp.]|nr:hypothetical protein [Candidatus Brocadia sp.]MCE7910618.1 hypothetical protein [Candidatus Brocadia sp. AMX3]MDG5996089.1 hypothetical protein [Candidatus Brocadia sp.]OQY97891.1 MAG: hypothetical protein B6D35_13480 [Candidatus Brocadia sp. UTAMX2]RIK02360.1 MAG: hypothetical protein DCC43_03445 [Candidatus Brocadia sp.]